jgi:HEAT repeat protein
MLNRTVLHLAFLSALLVVSLTGCSDAQEKVKDKRKKEATDPAVTARVTKLIEALKDESINVRSRPSTALAKIGPVAVPALIEALKDKDIHLRSFAALALGRIDPAAKDAVPALKMMSENDPAGIVRKAAAMALKSINK